MSATAVPPRFDPARRRAVTFALILVTALASFEATVVSTAMPTIIGDLNGLTLYSWVFSVYLLASTVTMPLYGRLADIHGRRRILLLAIALFLAGAGACAASRTMVQLIVARGLQGLGAGRLLHVALALLAVFIRLQRKRAHPLVPPVLFTRSETAAPYVAGALLGTTIYGIDTFVPLFVQGARGGTAGAAGAVVTPLVFSWAISAAV